MKPEVRDGFVAFTARFEGVVPFMYLDVLGLVTVAIGNLIDPMPAGLPFVRPDGTPATQAEINAAWHGVKARQDLRMAGGMAFRGVTSLRLTPAGVESVVLAKVAEMWAHLSRRYADLEEWPWQAQMALLSMSWASGPAFAAPHFDAAARAHDWATAATECHFDDTHNPGLRPRNAANRDLFLTAASLPSAPVADGPAANETMPSDTELP